MSGKNRLKNILGELPLTAEIYFRLVQQGRPLNRKSSLQQLDKHLPELKAQANTALASTPDGLSPPTFTRRRIVIFAMLRYWIEQAALLGMALAGQGHDVTLAYLPYPNWQRKNDSFDLRRQNIYIRDVLHRAAPLVKLLSLLDCKPLPAQAIPAALAEQLKQVALRDAQYTLQVEEVDCQARIYQLRLERNFQAAGAMLAWYQSLPENRRPEVLLTPNGSILEMGAAYQVARHLGMTAVTYEFGEQRGRIWLARNDEVMLQNTDKLWETRQDIPLNEDQWNQIRALYSSRQNGRLWENFSRLWQGLPSQGGEQARKSLHLDERPVVLLAANVIGDSLTLGRQVFSSNMTEWLQRTVLHFMDRPEVQLVVRIHPGERYLKGPSVGEVVQQVMPEIPAHIRLVAAPDPINTYDLVETADLGLAYTTTVGMEMAMSGVPVILGGSTHYRGKGFTNDPTSWEMYYQAIDKCLADPSARRLSRQQVDLAWRYAYNFFFEYPHPYPWHLVKAWDDLETWPLKRVLSTEGMEQFGETFRCLAGDSL